MERQTLRDLRIDAADDLERQTRVNGPRPCCQECGAQLPKGVQRPFCVMHSPYVQGIVHELIGAERAGRRGERPTRRVA